MNVSVAAGPLLARVHQIFGAASDPMPALERRAKELLPDERTIVWEADAGTLECTFVGASAQDLLGYPLGRWTSEPGFWATMIYEPDREEALAQCALCTGTGLGRTFRYRAVTADGRIVPMLNVVHVCKGKKGIARHLRGVLVDISAWAEESRAPVRPPAARGISAPPFAAG